jgi:DNA-binding GntR family transcriptional regulator
VAPKATTKVDFAYEQVRHWILVGELSPGEVLDQGALADAVGVSTTPMREALRRLESEDLLSIQAHRRVVVTKLSRQELDDIFAVRFELDPLAAFLAAKRISSKTVADLKAMTRGGEEDAVEQRIARHNLFHRTIYSSSGNAVLTRIIDLLSDRATRYRIILLRSAEHRDLAYEEHRQMIDAIERGDGLTLAQLTREHLAAAKRTIEENVDSAELD